MAGETVGNFGKRRLLNRVLGVAGPSGIGQTSQLPGGPGAGAALGGTRPLDASGEVLVVDAGVADQRFRSRVGHYPAEGTVGRGPGTEDRVAGRKVGQQGAVDGQQCAGGEAALPEVLPVSEGAEVEFRAAAVTMPPQFAPGHDGRRGRQVRAGGNHASSIAAGRERAQLTFLREVFFLACPPAYE